MASKHSQPEELFTSSLLKACEWQRAIAIEQVAKTLQPHDFENQRCALIYETALDLIQSNKPYDIPSITIALYDRVAPAYISELSNWDVTAMWQLEEFASEVARASQKRRMYHAGIKLLELAKDASIEPSEAFDAACEIVAKAEPTVLSSKGYVRVIDLMPEYMDNIVELNQRQREGFTMTGIDTQNKTLNMYTNGLQRKDLIILAAPPSVGKTAFMLDLLLNVTSVQNQYGCLFSIEMAKDKPMRDRMIANRSRIDMDRLKTGLLREEDWEKLSQGIASISDRFFIDDTNGMTIAYIKTVARQIRREIGKEASLLLCLDYLQMLPDPPGARNRNEGVGSITKQLKDLAKELDATVIVISSLRRGLQDRQDKRPTKADLRDSGEIEFHADLIWFLYRESYYNRKTEDQNITELIIDKHRNGPTGTILLNFNRQFGAFTEIEKR